MIRSTLVCGVGALVLACTAGSTASRLHGMNFFSNCYFSHFGNDDPIVYPNRPGASHAHTFFGARTTNAGSTVTSLRASATTCRRSGDTAAYWVPTLYENGARVTPTKGSAYFVLRSWDRMRAFPAGLKIVAGDAHATHPQPLSVTYWSCSRQEKEHWSRPHACKTPRDVGVVPDLRKSLLQLDVFFPDCWDGKRLDTPDHHSHMAYSRNYRCPVSHPVKVPKLRFIVTYPIRKPKDLTFASGGLDTAHADFFNAWDQRALVRIVAACFAYTPRCNEPPR